MLLARDLERAQKQCEKMGPERRRGGAAAGAGAHAGLKDRSQAKAGGAASDSEQLRQHLVALEGQVLVQVGLRGGYAGGARR